MGLKFEQGENIIIILLKQKGCCSRRSPLKQGSRKEDPGDYKEMSSILVDQQHPSYMSPNAGRVTGSQPMRTAVHIT